MARIQIVYPDDQQALLDQRIAQLRRHSRSYHCALLISDDLRAAGLLSPASPEPALAEFFAKVQAAHAASPRIVERLQATLRRSLRQPKSVA